MFSERLETIFTPEALRTAADRYRKYPGYEELAAQLKRGGLLEDLKRGRYIPGAAQHFELPKRSGGTRPIAVASLIDRIVQRVLSDAVASAISFSDRSYAYRPGKGPAKAVKRVLDEIRRGNFWIVRTDISSFFESIDQAILIERVKAEIEDPHIVELIALFVESGVMESLEYHDHTLGVHQGAPISPFLSNLYLDPFDRFLESQKIPFVRFGDDIVLLGRSGEAVRAAHAAARESLARLHLSIKEEKTVVSNISMGFEYLGVWIHNHTVRIEKNRLLEKIETLRRETKKLDLTQTVETLNEKIRGFDAYYARVVTDDSQRRRLQKEADAILVEKIADAKRRKIVNRQAEFRRLLSGLRAYDPSLEQNPVRYYDTLIRAAYAKLQSEQDPERSAEKKVARKKAEIYREQFAESEIVLGRPGLYLGYSRGRLVVKERGKVLRTFPLKRVSRVVVLATASLSTEAIYQCAERGVDIDFIRHNEPYAMLSAFRQPNLDLWRLQREGYGSRRFLGAARSMIYAKLKNQANLVKYHLRYRRKSDPELAQRLQEKVGQMGRIAHRLRHLHDRDAIRGVEGSCGTLYWECFGSLIGDTEYHRVTRDAPDAVNQALNYGYAILYHRVQSALLRVHLDIYTPLFHEPRPNRPALVFDLIEEFRQAVVDREIISILNRHGRLSTSGGRLTAESVERVTGHVQARLSGLTNYHGEKHRMADVILLQARRLARWIGGEENYRAFVAKY